VKKRKKKEVKKKTGKRKRGKSKLTNKSSKPQQHPHKIHPNRSLHPAASLAVTTPRTIRPPKLHSESAQQNDPEQTVNIILLE